MNRRTFLAAIGGVLGCPRPVSAQSTSVVPRICFLGASSLASTARFQTAFLEGMRDHGWTDGQNMRIDYLWAEGRLDRLAKLADQAVGSKCDLIFASGLTAARIVQARTTTIPIVSALLHDPVAEGFARSWSRPDGNVTGTSTINHDLLTKRIEIIREILPRLKTLAIVYDPTLPNLRHGFDDIAATATKLGVRAVAVAMVTEADIERVFSNIKRQGVDAVIVPAYPLVTVNRLTVATEAIKQGLPTIGEFAEFALDGGLASHGPDWVPLFRRSASHVNRILRGAKPGDLPIEQPTQYELVLNKKTAATLGIRFPQTVFLRADRIIE